MKILPVIFLTAILFATSVTESFAHGGFMKEAGSVKVYVKQVPVSPLVNEKVKFNVAFRDAAIPDGGEINKQDLAYKPVTVRVVDTFYGDESKDKVVSTKVYMTDRTGTIEFSETFTKENYFDIDFAIKDDKGEVQKTGFLVLPRDPKNPNPDLAQEYNEVVIKDIPRGGTVGILNSILEFVGKLLLLTRS